MILSLLLLGAGLVLLLGGGDALVRGASGIAARYGVPPIIIGLTVVAFGTSAPELSVNLTAALQGNGAVSFGNIFGSNLANIGLIVGLTAMLRPIVIHSIIISRELPMMILATVAALIMGVDGIVRGEINRYDRSDGLLLLLLFGVFLFYTAQDLLRQRKKDALLKAGSGVKPEESSRPLPLDVALTLGGLAGLMIGGKLSVDSAVSIATMFGVPEVIIGLTVLAVGTSLPELATSMVAAWRGHSDLAIGNIVGSNIFNVLLIMGLTAGIAPVDVPAGGQIDLIVLVLLSVALLPLSVSFGRRITRGEGALLLLGYLMYTGWRALTSH